MTLFVIKSFLMPLNSNEDTITKEIVNSKDII
jgi:hypothetical protein